MLILALLLAFIAFLGGWTSHSKLTRLISHLKAKGILEEDYK